MGDMGYPSLLTMPLRRDSDCDGAHFRVLQISLAQALPASPLGHRMLRTKSKRAAMPLGAAAARRERTA